jgi:hypothetical protein
VITDTLRSILFAAAALALSACGGTNPNDVFGNCTVTLSGAVTASLPCSVFGSYTPSTGAGALSLSASDSTYTLGLSFSTKGDLQTGTYNNSSALMNQQTAAGVLRASDNALWSQRTAASPPLGTLTLTLSSFDTIRSDSSGKVYRPHGSYDGILQAAPGTATNTVTAHLVF